MNVGKSVCVVIIVRLITMEDFDGWRTNRQRTYKYVGPQSHSG